jgi:hypothetical protein
VRRTLDALNEYLHPLKGGEDGGGWPFGGMLRYAALLRVVTKVEGVSAAPRLNLIVDEVRISASVDHPISANSLVWPAGHQVFVLDPEEAQ